ncbi:lipopolysaccharide heptosyltransferase RfaC [Candidatus Gillettellia adelgis]
MQVLIIKTSSMGDILHTLPALTDAMQTIPNIRFDWVVEEGFRQIPTWHPAVDCVIPVAIRRWRKNWFCSITRQQRIAFKRELQKRRYDLVIDAQGLLKSSVLITRFAKGSKHGQGYNSVKEPLASWFYNYRHNLKKQHAVERMRQLFAKSLDYDQPDNDGCYAISQRFLNQPPADAGQYLVFLHATTRTNKHWPEQNWRELIKLTVNSGIKIKLPWHTEHAHQRALRLAAGCSSIEVLPQLSLQQIAEVLSGAQGVVSVDTGLSHLAAALNKPNITLFGPTNPEMIGGYGQHQLSILSDNYKMKSISVDKVFALLKEQSL